MIRDAQHEGAEAVKRSLTWRREASKRQLPAPKTASSAKPS